jgi:hypothetical protein
MKRFLSSLLLLLLLTAVCGQAHAATPLGGLTVALNPEGSVLVAAGDSRVLYIMDPTDMQVGNRVWLGVSVVNLEFNIDGTRLIVEDTAGTLHLMDTSTWNVLKQEPKAERMSPARAQDIMACLNPDYNGHIIRFLSMTDLTEKGRVALTKEQKVGAFGIDVAATRLGILLDAVADESEPKASTTPADLKGIAREEFRLNNDGKTSVYLLYDMPGGTKLSETKLSYSPSSNGAKLAFQGEAAVVVNYSNLNALIPPGEQATLFQLDNSFNYGSGFSPDQTVVMSGGLSEGTYTVLDGLNKATFKPDKLPSWPEYFKGFAIGPDGTAYGATTAWRIMVIKPGGVLDKSYPVY